MFLSTNKPSAVACANALHDSIGGKDVAHCRSQLDCGWDRFPFSGPLKDRVSFKTWDGVFANREGRIMREKNGFPARTCDWKFNKYKGR